MIHLFLEQQLFDLFVDNLSMDQVVQLAMWQQSVQARLDLFVHKLVDIDKERISKWQNEIAFEIVETNNSICRTVPMKTIRTMNKFSVFVIEN